MRSHICTICGTFYAAGPPEICLICADDRQYLNPEGQAWTDMAALRANHRNDIRTLEPGLLGLGITPSFAISQRALVITRPEGGVMWDCTPLVTSEAVAALKAKGGVSAIAISHPHFFSSMGAWSEALGNVPIYLHEDHADWVMTKSPNIEFWSGENHQLAEGINLVRCGGHFPGSSVLHWAQGAAGKGVLMTGDTIMVTPDPAWMSFMYSYPNLVPLNARAVERIVKSVRAYPFDRLYAAWWDRVCMSDAKARLQRSAERYIAAIR